FYQCYIEYNNFLFSQTKGKLAFYFCAFFTTLAFILGYFHFKTMAKISSWNEFLFVYKFFMVALIVSYFNAFFGFFMLGASAILLFISWYKFKTLKES
ncbi:TPA: hypothetical protein ACW37D_001571, partial [Campylobacter jejuni]